MVRKLTIIAAWMSLAVVAYATLTRVGFVYSIYFKLSPFLMHPDIRAYASFEHVIAFALFGTICAFAYPKRIIFVCCLVFFSAAILEYLQTLTLDRHGTLIDAGEKIVGGGIGILAACAIHRLAQYRRRFQN